MILFLTLAVLLQAAGAVPTNAAGAAPAPAPDNVPISEAGMEPTQAADTIPSHEVGAGTPGNPTPAASKENLPAPAFDESNERYGMQEMLQIRAGFAGWEIGSFVELFACTPEDLEQRTLYEQDYTFYDPEQGVFVDYALGTSLRDLMEWSGLEPDTITAFRFISGTGAKSPAVAGSVVAQEVIPGGTGLRLQDWRATGALPAGTLESHAEKASGILDQNTQFRSDASDGGNGTAASVEKVYPEVL